MSREIIEDMSKKINKYEEMLGAILMGPKHSGVIISENSTHENVNFYRVDVAGQEVILPAAPRSILNDKPLKLKRGMQIMIANNAIVDILPVALEKIIKENKISLISWDEIGGLGDQIASIRESVELPLKNPDLIKEYGISPISGILLYGPPGCGKTLIAKAIAHTILSDEKTSTDAFIHITGGDIIDKYVGETEKIIAATFKKSRDYTIKTGKRGVIFIDEAEAVLGRRNGQSFSSVPTFLAEMDGMNEGKPLVIMATNLEDELDPAIIRDNRVDLRIFIDRPSKKDFEEIISIHLSKSLCHDKLEVLAKLTAEGIFNSTIRNSINGAMASSIVKFASTESLSRFMKNKGIKGITKSDVEFAVQKLIKQHTK